MVVSSNDTYKMEQMEQSQNEHMQYFYFSQTTETLIITQIFHLCQKLTIPNQNSYHQLRLKENHKQRCK